METGPAAGEMRLSFKGSAGDALKLPITHLIHASVGLRAQENRGRERGVEVREDRRRWRERGKGRRGECQLYF